MAAMKSAGSRRERMAAPFLIWAFVFIIVPIILIVYYSLTVESGGVTAFSWANYTRAFEPTYLMVMWRSILLALISTAVCVLAGYPIAYIMASKEYTAKGFLLFLFLVPMWMNFLLRTYAWIAILENNGIINTALKALGLPAFKLLYMDQAVVLGMVYNFLPFMILPIYTVLKKLDQNLIEAAQDLGADNRKVFLRLVLPLSMPGVISGVTMVFMPAVTTFIISSLLGGGQYMLIGNLIEQQFLRVGDWSFGSAISVILMVIILITMAVFSRVDTGDEGGTLF